MEYMYVEDKEYTRTPRRRAAASKMPEEVIEVNGGETPRAAALFRPASGPGRAG